MADWDDDIVQIAESQHEDVQEPLETLVSERGTPLLQNEGARPSRWKLRLRCTWTDNRGKGSILNKLMTTRYPSSAMEVQIALQRNRRAGCKREKPRDGRPGEQP